MRSLVFALAFLGFSVGMSVGMSGCFSPDEPICAFACGDNNACPDNYECRADSFCHLKSSTGDCPFPDASVPDFSISRDLSSPDMNMSMPDAADTD